MHVVIFHSTGGSRFDQNGTFEVRKSDVDKSDLPTSLPLGIVPSTVDVVVPADLDCSAYIVVTIQKVSGEKMLSVCLALGTMCATLNVVIMTLWLQNPVKSHRNETTVISLKH